MAEKIIENDSTSNILDVFERVDKHIHSFFDIILRKVEERRDKLLEQLDNMKLEYLEKEELRKKQVGELKKIIKRMSGVSIHDNTVADVKLNQMNQLESELEKFQLPTPIPFPVFRAKDLKPYLVQLDDIGVIESSSVHCIKKNPVRSVGKGKLDRPFGVCLDQDETVYVCDCGNSQIQVFSKQGEFLSEFGSADLDRPYGIAVTEEWVFVADWGLNAVSKFHKSECKLVNKNSEAGFRSPKNLTIDRENNVLVADCGNHRIAILNSELEFKGEIGRGRLKYPCGIQVTMSKIFVADYSKPHSIHVFSQAGDWLHSMIDLKLNASLISKNFGRHHIFLCFDKFGNILISATEDRSIQIYTVKGNLLHSIESKSCPTGIAITDDNTIVCAKYEPSSVKYY